MLVIERARNELLSLPLIVRLGLVILLVGGLADVVAHLGMAGHADHLHEHTSAELSAHVVGFGGMVVILLGVVTDGVRRSQHRRGVGASLGPVGTAPSPRT